MCKVSEIEKGKEGMMKIARKFTNKRHPASETQMILPALVFLANVPGYRQMTVDQVNFHRRGWRKPFQLRYWETGSRQRRYRPLNTALTCFPNLPERPERDYQKLVFGNKMSGNFRSYSHEH